MTLTTPYLYILMRTDLDSMNPGKAVAQGAHAANQFMHVISQMRDEFATLDAMTDLTRFPAEKARLDAIRPIIEQATQWENETEDGFGTTICLGVTYAELKAAVKIARALGFEAAITHDPSYPLLDGKVVHEIPLDTCGYVFGDKLALEPVLRNFKLMP